MTEQPETCTRCDTRNARGYLSIHNLYGEHVDCWATCFRCADADAADYSRRGFLVAFLTAPETIAAWPQL